MKQPPRSVFLLFLVLTAVTACATTVIPIPPTGPRPDTGSSVLGRWEWFNGALVEIRGDGTCADVKSASHGVWRVVDELGRTYELTWDGGRFVDLLVLSADGGMLSGKNQEGTLVTGRRVAGL